MNTNAYFQNMAKFHFKNKNLSFTNAYNLGLSNFTFLEYTQNILAHLQNCVCKRLLIRKWFVVAKTRNNPNAISTLPLE